MPKQQEPTIEVRICPTDWRELNRQLLTANETEVWVWLQEELKGPARLARITRLHGKFTRLRAARERAELLTKVLGR
jgi:hypothetical protein